MDFIYNPSLATVNKKIAEMEAAGGDTSNLQKEAALLNKVLHPTGAFDPQRQFMS